MRPKVVIIVLLLAMGLIAVMAWFSPISHLQPGGAVIGPSTGQPSQTTVAVDTSPMPVADPLPLPIESHRPTNTSHATATAPPLEKEDHDEMVIQRTGELNELAMEPDAESHQQIVNELNNPDRDIRLAALAALKQANDRSVIPQLQQFENQTEDPADKEAIQEVIDFINLPSLTEYLNKKPATEK